MECLFGSLLIGVLLICQGKEFISLVDSISLIYQSAQRRFY
jgi:hypothetical protein